MFTGLHVRVLTRFAKMVPERQCPLCLCRLRASTPSLDPVDTLD